MSGFTSRSTEVHLASLSVAIAPHASGRHIVHHLEPTVPFFYLGDTAWELPHRLNDAEAEHYLRNRAEKGFNVVMIVLFAEHGYVLPKLHYLTDAGDWIIRTEEDIGLSFRHCNRLTSPTSQT